MTPSDSELVARALGGDDREAFGALVQRHQSAVRRFLRHLTQGDEARADDLAQDTFLDAYRSLRHFRGRSLFCTWLLGIAHNRYRNARRRERNAQIAAQALAAPEKPAITATRAVDLAQDLGDALKKLSADEQLAIHLFYRQDLSHAEIATVAGWPLGTVKTHLSRAKDKLHSLLRLWNLQA